MCSLAGLLLVVGMLGSPVPPRVVEGEGDRIRARFEVDLVAKSQVVFVLPTGPRIVRSFRWTPDEDAPGADWRSARIRLVWDGDDPKDAGIDLPFGTFVSAAEEGKAGEAPGFENRRAMPYRRTARLVIDARGEVRGSVVIITDPGGSVDLDRGYLRARMDSEGSEQPTTGPGEIEENRGDGSPPGVRYWYDRRPGPSSDD